MGLLDYLSDQRERAKLARGLLDAVNRGAIGGLLGAPVDIANTAMRPFGFGSDNPVMGSEWIGDKMQQAGMVSENRNPAAEGLASFIDPATIGAGATKVAAYGGPLVAALGATAIGSKASEGAKLSALAGALNSQRGMIATPYGQIPENADDISALTGKRWFIPQQGMLERVMSDKKSERLFNDARESMAKSLFGHQNKEISYLTATKKQRAAIDKAIGDKFNPLKNIPESLQEKRYLRELGNALSGEINQFHKNKELAFNAIPVKKFNESGFVWYKSPNYNGRQSSEYKLMIGDDGVPLYARKSNHFGKFGTNIKIGTPEARELGYSDDAIVDDPFGRVGWKDHDWKIIGGDENAKKSQAGVIPLTELLFRK